MPFLLFQKRFELVMLSVHFLVSLASLVPQSEPHSVHREVRQAGQTTVRPFCTLIKGEKVCVAVGCVKRAQDTSKTGISFNHLFRYGFWDDVLKHVLCVVIFYVMPPTKQSEKLV